MMSKVKIVTSKPSRFGREFNIPVDGLVKVSAEGVMEVSEEAAELLVNGGAGWEYSNAKAAPKAKEDKPVTGDTSKDVDKVVEEPVEEEVEEEVEMNGEVSEGSMINEPVNFSGLTTKELKEVADNAGLPSKEWKRKNKNQMVKYLAEKMN